MYLALSDEPDAAPDPVEAGHHARPVKARPHAWSG
jgi:hypothetical protein